MDPKIDIDNDTKNNSADNDQVILEGHNEIPMDEECWPDSEYNNSNLGSDYDG